MPRSLSASRSLVLSFCLIYSPLFSLTPARAEQARHRTTPRRKPRKRPRIRTNPASSSSSFALKRPQKTQVIESFGKQHKRLRGRGGTSKLTLKDGFDLSNTIAALQSLNAVVEWAEPNYFVTRTSSVAQGPLPSPNDPQFAAQWALNNTGQNGGVPGSDIGAQGGWHTTTGSPRTIIAVIDTGVDVTHPDLAPNLWVNQREASGKASEDDDRDGYIDDLAGWNFVNNTNNVAEDHGHGTMMAGIIAARDS